MFLWQWNDYPPQPDPLMTRGRAAKLIRAWRNGARKPRNGRPPFGPIKRSLCDGFRVYRVESKYGERGAIWIKES